MGAISEYPDGEAIDQMCWVSMEQAPTYQLAIELASEQFERESWWTPAQGPDWIIGQPDIEGVVADTSVQPYWVLYTERIELLIDDIEAAYEDERYRGGGYLGARERFPLCMRAQIDQAVVDAANCAAISPAGFLSWMSSKNGRWFTELVFEAPTFDLATVQQQAFTSITEALPVLREEEDKTLYQLWNKELEKSDVNH